MVDRDISHVGINVDLLLQSTQLHSVPSTTLIIASEVEVAEHSIPNSTVKVNVEIPTETTNAKVAVAGDEGTMQARDEENTNSFITCSKCSS